MIKSELPMDPVQRTQSVDRAKPAPDAAGAGDFSRWIQPEDSGPPSSQRPGAEVAATDSNTLATAVVLSAAAGTATGILYGWGLQTQASLSQWVVDNVHGAHASSGIEPFRATGVRAGGVGLGSSDKTGSRVTGESTSVQMQMSVPALHRFFTRGERATESGSALPRQETMVAPLLWSERALRRVSTQDGGTTVWLRDYRLSPREIELALAELLSQAAEARPITRVVINGVEVWRQAPPTSQEIA